MASCTLAKLVCLISFYQAAGLQLNQSAQLKTRSSVHWVFVTDCSAYMFNQGNLLLTSAKHVGQEGNFTWIVYGCRNEEQKAAFSSKLNNPNAQVWHSPKVDLIDPDTGKQYPHFQASNRPLSVDAWWKAVQPQEDVLSIIDPDMMFLRAVHLSDTPGDYTTNGAWETIAPKPGHGTGAKYGQGCIPNRWTDAQFGDICGQDDQKCIAAARPADSCQAAYSSGPPWNMHRDDAPTLLNKFPITALKVHETWADLLSEQVAYGVTQMKLGMDAKLDNYWFLSGPIADEQPWDAVKALAFDPCRERSAPPKDMPFPPLWHSCSTYEIPHLQQQGYRLHKDHIHKDLLDCAAPLLHYPPHDALEHYDKNSLEHEQKQGYRETWSVCTYTNLVNAHATAWKNQFCEAPPNLQATAVYPSHAQHFYLQDSWLKTLFRSGGWSDVDYKVSLLSLSTLF